jgi:hypothetical protein
VLGWQGKNKGSAARPLSAIVAALLVAGFSYPAAAGVPIRRTCIFEQGSNYSAVGTRAACSTLTHKNKGEHCEVSFGATGAEEPLVSKLIGKNVDEYRRAAFQATQRNLEAMLSETRSKSYSTCAWLKFSGDRYRLTALDPFQIKHPLVKKPGC